MSAVTLDTRPAGINVPFRPGNEVTIELAWPSDSLSGRTFSAYLGSTALEVSVAGDGMTIVASAALTSAKKSNDTWRLLETTGGATQTLIRGVWKPSDEPRDSSTTTATVVIEDINVTVSVISEGASIVALDDRLDTVEAALPTKTDLTAFDTHTADRLVHIPRVEFLEHQPAVKRWRQKLATARAAGLSVQLVIIGDSIPEGSGGAKYRNRAIDRLRRRFMGSTPGTLGLLPASAGVFSQIGNAIWAGGDDPWTYAGGVGGNINYGLGFHAADVPSGGGSASITYFGDKIAVFYTRSTTGPTACAVTLDGVAQTAINANGAESPSLSATFGTAGNYGFHTLVLTPNNGTLILEGVEWFDGDQPVFTVGSVILLDGSHAGFGADAWAGQASNTWSAMLQNTDVFYGGTVVMLGLNDFTLGRTPTQFQADLATIASRIDARLASTEGGYLFVMVPGTQTTFVDAARAAAAQIGLERASVYDLGALRPNRLWGADLSTDGTHPNEAGQIWLAEALGQVLDPTPATLQPVTPTRQVIDYSTPATARSSWTEAPTSLTNGIGGFDASGGGTTVGERRHRVWLDPGTYRATITMQEDTGLGTVEVLIGRWVANTPTLTSCGTKANAAGTPTLVTTRLGTTITTDVAGWVPVVIRKTSASGLIRFVQLVIDKTA